MLTRFVISFAMISLMFATSQAQQVQVSGIYPHLAMFNDEGECGTGAVVPWADKLWVVTYAPHKPSGSSDKLYEISRSLGQRTRAESIGGTPANRMVHRESQQLFIGPYAIDSQGQVRVIPYSKMFGRPTGNARHLTVPENKIYYATMEEGLYEVDVTTLDVVELWADEQRQQGRHAGLPGYHGKGIYSGQGVVVYANNGEHGPEALQNPSIPSGVLAEWDGVSDTWKVVRRNQFTEVTGPGGIWGTAHPDDPIWSIGWDHRSLILMCREGGNWHSYRLPKASHSYDGAHGWNTEWPRIRDIGESDLLMTMHGAFWRFPKNFRSSMTSGIAQRSTYLKVIADFCRWEDRIVLGCDDTAKNEFLNKRRAKGTIAAPQSQSNLWFLQPEQLDQLGPTVGHGAVWLNDDVAAGIPSEPFLLNGFTRRGVHLGHQTDQAAVLTLEVDQWGDGNWKQMKQVKLPANSVQWVDLMEMPEVQWMRVVSDQQLTNATAMFHCSNPDKRAPRPNSIFNGLAEYGSNSLTGGIVRARDKNTRTLHFVSSGYQDSTVVEQGLYELDSQLKLKKVQDPAALDFHKRQAAIPLGVLQEDDASIIFVDEQDRRWRIPRSEPNRQVTARVIPSRVCREVATERDLFNAAGSFFELPAENAGGFSKVRAVATHNFNIIDFCSYRGLLVMSGVDHRRRTDQSQIVVSDDGQTALWVGTIDDVWQMGKPRGVGGPWKDSNVRSKLPSDPYLMNGYDQKRIRLSHNSKLPIQMRVEADVSGAGDWLLYQEFSVEPNKVIEHDFPIAYSAYWLRIVADTDCVATAQLEYQ